MSLQANGRRGCQKHDLLIGDVGISPIRIVRRFITSKHDEVELFCVVQQSVLCPPAACPQGLIHTARPSRTG